MSKKKKEETEEEQYEFKLPEFDEKDFIQKEVKESKAMIIVIFYAMIFSVVSLLLYMTPYPWYLSFVIGILGMFGMKFVLDKFKFDTKDFEKKHWAGLGGTYFITWLSVFVLILNPPFSDFSPPEIKITISIGHEGKNGTEWKTWNKTTDVYKNDFILINATIFDNTEVDFDSVKIFITYPNNTTNEYKFQRDGNSFSYNITANQIGDYKIKISANDKSWKKNFSEKIVVLVVRS